MDCALLIEIGFFAGRRQEVAALLGGGGGGVPPALMIERSLSRLSHVRPFFQDLDLKFFFVFRAATVR